jgi:hypothetical protein
MPVHIAAEVLRSTGIAEHYGTVLAGALGIAFVHSWARGPALLDREERLEAQQRRAKDKDPQCRVTAGLGAMGARVVLVAVGPVWM